MEADEPQPGPLGLQSHQGTADSPMMPVPTFPAMVQAENYFLKQQIESLTAEMAHLKVAFSFRHIEYSNALIRTFTGIPTKDIYMALFSLYENIEIKYYSGWQVTQLPKVDQLLL